LPFSAYFDTPTNYPNKFNFYNVGSSPLLLEKLLDILDNEDDTIEEIKLGLYLFNNKALNKRLVELANHGVKVDVVTIPIEGYDTTNPKEIINIQTNEIESSGSKYDFAKTIFEAHYRKEISNYTLYFFPHIYLRSENVKAFSRGEMPYSLHLKSFLIKYKNKIGTIGLSSSNFAVRDLAKEENLLIVENEADYFNPAYSFFNTLLENALPIYDFDFKKDYTNYAIKTTEQPLSNKTNFIAPFYFDAAFKAEEIMLDLISSAVTSIKIVAQHICPVSYNFNGNFHSGFENKTIYKEGLLNKLIEKANSGIKVEFISQTFASSENNPDIKFRVPVNKTAFIEFYNAIKNIPNISYAVNENIHSKYIIIDEKVFVSSFNYTPTQFIYLDKVDIKTFKNNPGKSYKGIHCETGQYCIVENTEIAKAYKNNFTNLLAKKETVLVKKLYLQST